MESAARSEVSTVGNGGDLPNRGARARFLQGEEAEGDGGADGVLGEARGRRQRRRRAAKGELGFRAFAEQREEKQGKGPSERERRDEARRRGPYPRERRPGRGAGAAWKQRTPLPSGRG